jgi:peptidoglycan/LPS O-acetylase OafA/YrhL
MQSQYEAQDKSLSATVTDARLYLRSFNSQRIPALDFTKGALVLLMVLYHWINYFVGPQWGYYQYLRFLTPLFIFISGFMISHVYLSKYAVSDVRLSKRLFERGAKLLTVFIILNLTRIMVVPALGTGTVAKNLPDRWSLFAIFVSGNLPISSTKLVSFSILVPISYLLCISGALMYPMRYFKYTFHSVCIFLFLSVLTLGLLGMRSFNLEYVDIGMMGIVIGFRRIETIKSLVRHPFAIAFGYLCYLIAITIWNVPFPLLVVGVALSVMAIYFAGEKSDETGAVSRRVLVLGKYSLLGYISQIGILQVLSAGFHRLSLGASTYPISFAAAFALTIASVELVDYARARSTSVDRLYKVVFA